MEIKFAFWTCSVPRVLHVRGAHCATLVEYLSDVFHPIRDTLTRTFENFIDVKKQQSCNTFGIII